MGKSFTCVSPAPHLLPRLILVLPGSGKEAGGGELAQMGLGVEAAPPGPTGAVGQDLDGQRTQVLRGRRLPAGRSSAKACSGTAGLAAPPPLRLSVRGSTGEQGLPPAASRQGWEGRGRVHPQGEGGWRASSLCLSSRAALAPAWATMGTVIE